MRRAGWPYCCGGGYCDCIVIDDGEPLGGRAMDAARDPASGGYPCCCCCGLLYKGLSILPGTGLRCGCGSCCCCPGFIIIAVDIVSLGVLSSSMMQSLCAVMPMYSFSYTLECVPTLIAVSGGITKRLPYDLYTHFQSVIEKLRQSHCEVSFRECNASSRVRV